MSCYVLKSDNIFIERLQQHKHQASQFSNWAAPYIIGNAFFLPDFY